MPDYTRAQDVHSPQDRWTLKKVVHDEGESLYAVAIGTWRLADSTEQPRLALRWNGEEGRPAGTPSSRGHATWFFVPDPLAAAIADTTLRLITRSGLNEDARVRAEMLVEWAAKIPG